jgi:hypothetical protein
MISPGTTDIEYRIVDERSVVLDLQPPSIPEAWMIGARTRLLDCWEPQAEWIRLPELQFPARQYSIRIKSDEPSSRPNASSAANQVAPISIDGAFYDARMHGGANIAHCIINGLAITLACRRALSVLGRSGPDHVVVPANTASFVIETFRLFGITPVPTDGLVMGDQVETNLDAAACIQLGPDVLPKTFQSTLDAGTMAYPRRLFLARRGSRSIRNDREVESILVGEGFQTIYPERLAVVEQFRHIWNADLIVGIHGAAFAPIMFRSLKSEGEPLGVLELFGPGYIVTLYRHMTGAIGGRWVGVRGHVSPEVVRDLGRADETTMRERMISVCNQWLPRQLRIRQIPWERRHESSPLEIDPETVQLALRTLSGQQSGPAARIMYRT